MAWGARSLISTQIAAIRNPSNMDVWLNMRMQPLSCGRASASQSSASGSSTFSQKQLRINALNKNRIDTKLRSCAPRFVPQRWFAFATA